MSRFCWIQLKLVRTHEGDGLGSALTSQVGRTEAAGPVHENAKVVGVGSLAKGSDSVH